MRLLVWLLMLVGASAATAATAMSAVTGKQIVVLGELRTIPRTTLLVQAAHFAGWPLQRSDGQIVVLGD